LSEIGKTAERGRCQGADSFFALWGIPFVAVGLHFIVGRFFVDAQQRANTFYGVTNQRVIIVSGILNSKVKSLNLRTLSDLTRDERSNGKGSIVRKAQGAAT
jgi:hypothetical protein